ncbi:glycosyltransferase family 4 protein, partial [Patescibacteria group bacterium]|nr:glycosyltransferase family 4 protein [Patescibacteria group bacterium]
PLENLHAVGFQYNPFRNYQIRKILKKSVSKIISPSSALELALNQNGIKNTEVIPNGIDVNDWQCSDEEIGEFKKRFNLEGRNVVLFAGRLSLDKGAIPLLKAIDAIRKEIPNVTLLVAGEQRRWDGIAKAAGVTDELSPYIVNTGWLNHDDMRIANHAADVITVPSLCLDVFPSANLEAMAAGKPVIGTIFGGTPEIVEDGETGFIRNPLEQEEFTSSLLKLLKDDDLARRMGQAGLERVKNEYSLESQIERYVELFE